ncbi:MAG: DNA oxidative demethylase AlkB [Pseudomonas sp.]|uniref:DNA oxidative demethylase AlkB n=1 Tax=Pseudomonas sp. TaxID=306 RepID=UPI00239898FE|nr:DNA oxidative demethylase AlkB [Pseudomonas sp.]MDE1194490.1 DNA oxidative demethylase AlkB [Pseudomonas sp.]
MQRKGTTPVTLDLFADDAPQLTATEQIGPQSFVFRGLALPLIDRLLPALEAVLTRAPFRNMITPGGYTMSVALSSCGQFGWTTDRSGYQYTRLDPHTGQPWPPMPDVFMELAQSAAQAAGFADFLPDACLINRYIPGAKLALHQDKDERGYEWPVVSVSLGIAAMFLFGGHARSDATQKVPLFHGDVVVWGGEDRLRYHGVMPIKQAEHPQLGEQRINFTFRKAR